MRKYIINILLSVVLSTAMYSCIEQDACTVVSDVCLNGTWLFISSDSSSSAEVESRLVSGDNVSGCTMITLPHTASATDTIPWQNTCFYSRKFVIPENMNGKRLSLRFEGVAGRAVVWVNGKEVARHYGDLPFVADFNPEKGENIAVVKLGNVGDLYGNVWLCAKDSLSFTDEGEFLSNDGGINIHTFDIGKGNGQVSVNANVRNSYTTPCKIKMECRVLDHNNVQLARSVSKTVIPANDVVFVNDSIKLDNITPWDIDTPWLYTLEVKLICDGKVIDQRRMDFGFRDIKIKDGKFAVNGKERFLMGVSYNPIYPYVGRTLTEKSFWRDAYKIKRGGFDFVDSRGRYYPESFLAACDYFGIIILDSGNDSQGHARKSHPCLISGSDAKAGVVRYDVDVDCPIGASEAVKITQANTLLNSYKASCSNNSYVSSYASMFDSGILTNGVMGANRQPKFSYYFMQSQRDIDENEMRSFADPVCNIASYWQPGESRGVRVYSNCSTVELFVDGVSKGRKSPDMSPDAKGLRHPSFYYDVVCNKPGTLKAIAYNNNGAPVAESTVKTPETPVRLKLVFDESGAMVQPNDIIFVHCYVLDKNGSIVVSCADSVEFSVTGTAQLLSPSVIKCESGVASALVRTGISANDIAISAKCGSMYSVIDR